VSRNCRKLLSRHAKTAWSGTGGDIEMRPSARLTRVAALGIEEQRVNVVIVFTGHAAERATLQTAAAPAGLT